MFKKIAHKMRLAPHVEFVEDVETFESTLEDGRVVTNVVTKKVPISQIKIESPADTEFGALIKAGVHPETVSCSLLHPDSVLGNHAAVLNEVPGLLDHLATMVPKVDKVDVSTVDSSIDSKDA